MVAASKLLLNGGILVVVSFHSIEDKIVKPWGSYEVLLKDNKYQVKRINVSPGKR